MSIKGIATLKDGARFLLGMPPAAADADAATDVTIVALGGQPGADAANDKKPADCEGDSAPMPADDEEEDGGEDAGGKKKKDKMEPAADAAAAATAAANARWATVMTNEASVGKFVAATTMLAESTMTADAIIKTLAALPSAPANNPLASLMEQANPDLGTGSDASASPAAVAASVWDKAIAKLNPASRG